MNVIFISKYSLFCLPVTVVLLFIILLLRIYLITITDIPLHFDEAQYWSWSQDLKWGYFSKPPLISLDYWFKQLFMWKY